MTYGRRFVQYQVRGKWSLQRANSHRVEWTLLSPESTFEKVDLPFWEKAGATVEFISLTINQTDVRSTISDFSLQEVSGWTKAAERRKLVSASPQMFHSLDVQHHEVSWGKSLEGRQLLLNETMSAWNQYFGKSQTEKEHLMRTLQKLYLQGFFDWNSTIHRKPACFCRRCGYGEDRSDRTLWQRCKAVFGLNQRLIEVTCASCGREDCSYCPRCLRLGIAKSCEPYLDWSSVDKQIMVQKEVPFHWNGQLSSAQQEASDQLVQFIRDAEQKAPKEFLIWAVTGAGKTEILFSALHQLLQKEKKILITSPRRDVILELAPRIKEVFPISRIRVLHGESDEKYEAGDLFLATTHQALRFQHFFDMVVVDEEDAFPYHFDKMLAYVVQRAKKKEGLMVYLTATPTNDMIQRAQREEIGHVLIPKRFHDQPLAVPNIQPVGKWRKLMENKVVLTELVQFISHLVNHKRYGYIFVPHISDLPLVQEYIMGVLLPYLYMNVPEGEKDNLEDLCIESVHASHPQRTEVVQRFRDHKIDILITTTILERGVTIPYSDVAVLGSDDPVFNAAALIQMAGRAGRKAQDPVGNVWLFPEVRTKDQAACIRMIRKWNETAVGK
jgi:competence protein ComFA